MNLNARILGSITNTEGALPGAQYSSPSDPTQILVYFQAPSPTPSIKLNVRVRGSIANSNEAFSGAQYSNPSGPTQMP